MRPFVSSSCVSVGSKAKHLVAIAVGYYNEKYNEKFFSLHFLFFVLLLYQDLAQTVYIPDSNPYLSIPDNPLYR